MCACPATSALAKPLAHRAVGRDDRNDAISSGMTGLRNAASSSSPMLRALMRSMRERPEPFSIASSGIGMPLLREPLPDRRCAPCRVVPGAPLAARAQVRKSCRAITLLLYLLMSRTTSESAVSVAVASSRAPGGRGRRARCP